MADTRTPGRSISRRTLAKGAGWSVPTVALASAAPALASSLQTPPTFKLNGYCKSPGKSCKTFPKGYEFRFTVCNNSPVPIWIHGVSYTTVGTNLTLIHASPSLPIALDANECRNVAFRADSSNSANQEFDFTMTIIWNHSSSPTGDPNTHLPYTTPTFRIPGTPPDCACPDGMPPASAAAESSSTSSSSSSLSTSSAKSASATSTSEAPASTQAPAATSKSAAPASEAPTSTAAPSGS